MGSFKKRLGIAVCATLALYAAAAIAIAWHGLQDHATTADIIVVPGNTVQADGSLSGRLQARLDVAIELFHEQRAPRIFVSGGTGREGHDEAAAMAQYLLAQGVPASAVVQDPLGVDTAATAVNAAQYLRANRLGSALVATQYFHIARTELALQRNGVRVAGARHARYFELRDLYSLAREVIGYAVYYVK
jgi:vancomycin permeability regulator SanA